MTSLRTDERASAATAAAAGQYLIFYLGRREYGIQVLRIREIISLIPLQLSPGLPYCVRGLVTILGQSIPVIDLGLKLGLAGRQDPDATWTSGEARQGGSGAAGPGYIVMIDTGPDWPGPGLGAISGGTALTRPGPARGLGWAGIAVDHISGTMNLGPEDIEPAASAPGCVLGLVRAGRHTRTLLDIDQALSLDSEPDQALSRRPSSRSDAGPRQ